MEKQAQQRQRRNDASEQADPGSPADRSAQPAGSLVNARLGVTANERHNKLLEHNVRQDAHGQTHDGPRRG